MTADIFRCWAEIDTGALRRNAQAVRQRIRPAEVLAVVKANAYGHGMIRVAETLTDQVDLFGVANLEEATAVRAVVPNPIMILGPALPHERAEIAHRKFIPTISTVEEAEDFNQLASDKPLAVNFKVDTGMGRMGTPERTALTTFQKVAALPTLHIHSISTHMPVADEDAGYTRDQLVRFRGIVNQFRAHVPGNYKAHVLQTAGTLAFATDPFDIVRVGIMFYGISPLPEYRSALEPILTWKTRVGLVREVPEGSSISYGRTFITRKPMRVATITAGYADGYPRHLSNRDTAVLVRGQRCPLLGRVTMDLMVVDVSHAPGVTVGDEVVLMGRQGEAEIPCWELADRAATITWDIVSRIGPRVKRLYI